MPAGASKQDSITNYPSIFILQLKVFINDNRGRCIKVVPNILIQDEITRDGITLKLHGIVWHTGTGLTSGHYTSTVKVSEKWFLISDDKVERKRDFPFKPEPNTVNTVPYLLIYKQSDRIVFEPSA